jgi:LacI family transcriptional regulator
MRAATLKSISRATGFSVTTVSRALGGFDDVNEETRQLILAEAQKQNYEPNLLARLLQGQRSQILGLVIPASGSHFSDPFFAALVASVGNTAASAHFDLLISTHSPRPNDIEPYQRLVAGRRVDGLILSRIRQEDARIQYLREMKMPFVVFGRTSERSHPYVYIDVDGQKGQSELTEHFIQLGHRRIAYISPPQDMTFSKLRIQGFLETLAAHSLPIIKDYLLEGDLTEAGGYRAAEFLLNLAEKPSAIMTGNDSMALGVMSCIQQLGLRVGEDIAVAGFDDIPAAAHVHPGLTTIRQPIYQIGEALTRTLLEMINGNKPKQTGVLLNAELIIRGSSG